MDNLRNMILGNMTWSSEYDINNDNTIDMLDIIALKDINNINKKEYLERKYYRILYIAILVPYFLHNYFFILYHKF